MGGKTRKTQGTLPAIKPAAGRARALAVILPVYTVAFFVAKDGHEAQIFLGLLAWFALSLVTSSISVALASALGARLVWVTIGAGPKLDTRVVGGRVRVIRALPISLSGVMAPKPEHFLRDWRIITSVGLFGQPVLGAIAILLLPTPAGVVIATVAVITLVLRLTMREPTSGRSLGARMFLAASPQNDPAVASADRQLASQGGVAVQFGDVDQAEAILARLRTDPAAAQSTALLAVELLAARGEFDAALRVRFPEPDPAESPALTDARRAIDSARNANLLLLATERDPSLAPKAAPLALRHLRAVTKAKTAATADRSGRALYALQAGDLRAAVRESRVCVVRAKMPLAIADALCTRALIEARRGKPAKAVKILGDAARFAPWYPRVAHVRQLVDSGAAMALTTGYAADPMSDTSHVFDEPWSVPAASES